MSAKKRSRSELITPRSGSSLGQSPIITFCASENHHCDLRSPSPRVILSEVRPRFRSMLRIFALLGQAPKVRQAQNDTGGRSRNPRRLRRRAIEGRIYATHLVCTNLVRIQALSFGSSPLRHAIACHLSHSERLYVVYRKTAAIKIADGLFLLASHSGRGGSRRLTERAFPIKINLYYKKPRRLVTRSLRHSVARFCSVRHGSPRRADAHLRRTSTSLALQACSG